MNFDLGIAISYLSGVFLTSAAPSVGAIDVTNVAGGPQSGLWSNQYVFNLNNPVGVDGQQRTVLENTQVTISNTIQKNYQINALYDFLSLYSITRNNGGEAYGWDDLPIANAQSDIIRKALFGDGTKTGDIISDVRVGGDSSKFIANATRYGVSATAKQNSLESLRSVLTALGVDNKNLDAHFNHFHVDVNPPKRVEINNLLADAVVVADSGSVVVPPASSLQKYDAAFSVCQAVVPTTHRDFGLANGVGPGAVVTEYFMSKGVSLDSLVNSPSSTILVVKPSHGDIQQDSNGAYVYYPNNGYLGPDQMTFVVELMGKKFKVIQTVWVANVSPEYGGCPAGYKLPPATTGNDKRSALDVIELPVDGSFDMDALAKLHAFVSFAAGAGLSGSGVSMNIADLPGAAVGQTVGSTITLDTNAAGNNWFIDSTPGDNSEFLPTSNPYEWVAKEGSAAYGKMDMLSVLLHEYGHALGIDHSADGHDYMATTLTVGVRRMPSAEELALMQQLVGEVKVEMTSVSAQGSGNIPSQLPLLPLGGFGLAFLGRLRSSRYGSLNVEADLSTLVTQFAVTANAKLTNGNFSVASGMPVDNGWATQGSVVFADGAATLKEVSTSQTRLNQVFVVNPRDRFLSFTIAGSVLDDVNGAPDDAFEVALLDGKSVV